MSQWLTVALFALPALAWADLPGTVATLRGATCPRHGALPLPLHRDTRLDTAARRRAQGSVLHDALAHSGYIANSSAMLHASGPERAVREALRSSGCAALTNPTYRDVGYFTRGSDAWIVLADPYRLPTAVEAADFVRATLRLTNEARAHGAPCGRRRMPPAPALRPSSVLNAAADVHATDMARQGYFDHLDHNGRTPADRVQRAGYREAMIGENIAYGPATPEEVVNGWLASPEHCENLMDARFTEMGLAFEAGHGDARPGLYWVQELGLPASRE